MAESRSVEQERKDSAVKEENIHMEQEKQAEAPETKEASERLLHDVRYFLKESMGKSVFALAIQNRVW